MSKTIFSIKFQFVFGLMLGIMLYPSLVFAGPIVRSGDTVSVEADQILESDFYGAGGTVSISGSAEHDVYVTGGSVTINAPVDEDLVIIGGTVQIHGPVGDDLRIIGGEVTLAEEVGGDVVVLGGTLNILSTARIEGDILFFSGEVEISGNVKGGVAGMADIIRIDAGVGGDVKVTARQSLAFGDRSEILGNVTYRSENEIARAQGAVIVGDIVKESIDISKNAGQYALLPVLVLLFAALSAYLLFKSRLQKVIEVTKVSYGVNGLIGLAVLLAVPAVGALLIISILGLIPGIVILITYIVLLILTWVISGIVLGSLVLKSIWKSEKSGILSVIVGVILFDLLVFIPYIGPLLGLAVFLIVLGGISRLIYQAFRS